ncbi:MAG TPA: IS1182 family transposase [Armatimonadota bacterium]|nr:IS1182 family transposase [Armatimonadota bacterium]
MCTDGRFLELPDRDQLRVFAPSLRQAVAADQQLLALDAALEQLDLSALEADYTRVGHPAFPPRVMLKIHIYGYLLGLRSSRSLDRACRYDDAFRFLAHGLAPDFRTLCRFRRRHAQDLEQVFVQTVRRCQAAGLVSLGHVAIDGSKLRANRSKPGLAAALGEFRQALAEAEAADRDLPREAEEQATEEARFMKTSEGVAPAYNAQIAVDADHQIIVAQQVRTEASDHGLLREMVAQVAENCGDSPERVSADGGYFTAAEVEALEAGPSELHLPRKVSVPREASKYEWVEAAGAYRCPAGEWLRPYRVRGDYQIYRTVQCQGCAQAEQCGVRGRSKEVHVPRAETARGKLARRMASEAGQAVYAARKAIVEPVFGRFKHNWGARRLLLRGRSGAQVEWTLLCLAHNLTKWIQAGGEGSAGGRGAVGRALSKVVFWLHKLHMKNGSGVAVARA